MKLIDDYANEICKELQKEYPNLKPIHVKRILQYHIIKLKQSMERYGAIRVYSYFYFFHSKNKTKIKRKFNHNMFNLCRKFIKPSS